jgi:hypothetical protein
MRRIEDFVWPLYIALVLCLIGLSGAKAENFGGWVLEHRGGSFMATLSFKQSASVSTTNLQHPNSRSFATKDTGQALSV